MNDNWQYVTDDRERALSQLQAFSNVKRQAQKLIDVGVQEARLSGATWAQIAKVLRVSRQAAAERYGKNHG